jgi:hypothetical protein
MPDIEALMQIWPAKFEELLDTVSRTPPLPKRSMV